MSEERSTIERVLALAAAAGVAFAAYQTLRYLQQPLLEGYVARQGSTAVAARWLELRGPMLHPAIVHGISAALKIPISAAGRLFSFLSLVLCVLPMQRIFARASMSRVVLPIFVLIFFSLPLSLSVGLAFLPDTFALYLALSAVAMAGRPGWQPTAAAALLLWFSCWERPVVGVPVAVALFVARVWGRDALSFLLLLPVSFVALLRTGDGISWPACWAGVRAGVNASVMLGVVLIAGGWLLSKAPERRSISLYVLVVASAILAARWFGEGEQSDFFAAAPAFAAAVAVALVALTERSKSRADVLLMTALLVSLAYRTFAADRFERMRRQPSWDADSRLAVGELLRIQSSPSLPVAIMAGADSYVIAFYAERRLRLGGLAPSQLAKGELGGIVMCPGDAAWAEARKLVNPSAVNIAIGRCQVIIDRPE